MNFRSVIELGCRWFIGLIFVYASVHKIMDPCQMASDIYHYRMLPGVLINLIAIVLPYMELVLGLSLIAGFLPRGAAFGLVAILSVFVIVLTINLIRGIDFTCGCFSAKGDWCELFADWVSRGRPDMIDTSKIRIRTACDIVRDLIFIIPAATAFVLLRRRLQLPRRDY
ncbi:DoxX family membrane protein [bacterium]|nr:DoxX family membrane protein [candidate division CSSED10-310 bacterium]